MPLGFGHLFMLLTISFSALLFEIAKRRIRQDIRKTKEKVVQKRRERRVAQFHSRQVDMPIPKSAIRPTQPMWIIFPLIFCSLAITSTGCDEYFNIENASFDEYSAWGDDTELENWLEVNPRIAKALYWNNPYPLWESERKAEFKKAVEDSQTGLGQHWSTPPVNQRELHNHDHPDTVFSAEDAWRIYCTTTAAMIAFELDRELPWSVQTLDDESITALFDSRTIFRVVPDGYQLLHRSVPASPHETIEFLSAENILGHNRLETIIRLMKWSHQNQTHFLGRYESENVSNHWNYRGAPPVSHILQGTTNQSFGFSHWTAGCRGTTAFFQSVLRVVNIPVRQEIQCGHALPYFVSEGLYLSHGDDPYNSLWPDGESIPVEALLISRDTHHHWFGDHNEAESVCNNVSRQTCELAKGRISAAVIKAYCLDQSNSGSNWRNITEYLQRCATPEEATAESFLRQVAEKVRTRGGC
jgi:hypothetical protein